MAITSTTGVGRYLSLDQNKLDEITRQVSASLKDGTLKATDLTPLLMAQREKNGGPSTPGYQDRYEGKTVVENKGTGLIIGSTHTPDGNLILDASYGESREKSGAPDHAFFYHETDFLLNAAKEYAKLGEDEVFRHRNIRDVNFVRDSLDFFTGGKYSQAEVNTATEQMTDVVFELAEQIKNGEAPDLSKLQTKLTIGGADMTISQLMDFQKVGNEVKQQLDQFIGGNVQMERFGKMGIAKAFGDFYGSDKGEAGAMFSSAIDRLYERNVAGIKKANEMPFMGRPAGAYERSIAETSAAIRDTFATLDTSSKEALTKDFAAKLAAVRGIVQSHNSQFNVPESHSGLSGATDGLMKYFNAWMSKM